MQLAPALTPQGPKSSGCAGVALWGGLSALDFRLPGLHGAACPSEQARRGPRSPHAGIGRAVGAFAVLPEHLRSCLSRLDNHLREFFPFGKLRVRMTISTGTALRMTIYFPLQLAAKCEGPAGWAGSVWFCLLI
jgi:hypothetical protein